MIHKFAENGAADAKYDSTSLDRLMIKYTSEIENHLQGITFSAFDDQGNTVYSKAAGKLSLDQESSPLTINSPIWIASITKLFTTIACLIVVEKELIGLDDSVRDILPFLQKVEVLDGFTNLENGQRNPHIRETQQPITLRQLLTHTSGFSYDVFDKNLMEWSCFVGRKAHAFCGSYQGYQHPLVHEPGEGWTYGCGFDWAGQVVEVLTGQSLEDFMQENIFTPLKMTETAFRPELRTDDYLARVMEHAKRDPVSNALTKGNRKTDLLPVPAQDCLGGLGLYSTPTDLLKFLKELFPGHSKIVTEASIAKLFKPQLNETTKASFMEVIDGRPRSHLRATWPAGSDGTFGLGSALNSTEFPGRRGALSANWAGASGLHVWIDPSSGIGGLLTTQLVPPGDKMFTQCLVDLETALYQQL